MIGRLQIAKPIDNLSFSNGFEFKDDEYLKALQAYSGFDLETMSGQKEIVFCNDKKEKKNDKKEEFEYFSCECDIIDEEKMKSLSCYDFFNIFYNKDGVKKITLALNYDLMDNEFDDEIREWVYDSSLLLKKAVSVFGIELLPKKDFYFELINDKGEKIIILFADSYLINKNANLITIGALKMKIIEN
jgi:hypothetical protein